MSSSATEAIVTLLQGNSSIVSFAIDGLLENKFLTISSRAGQKYCSRIISLHELMQCNQPDLILIFEIDELRRNINE